MGSTTAAVPVTPTDEYAIPVQVDVIRMYGKWENLFKETKVTSGQVISLEGPPDLTGRW